MRFNGIVPNYLDKETEVLIVGHNEYEEKAIKELLEWREGKELRVYSQEMFLAHWTTGKDSFEYEGLVEAFAEDHKALQFLKACWIDWISTNVVIDKDKSILSLSSNCEKLKINCPADSQNIHHLTLKDHILLNHCSPESKPKGFRSISSQAILIPLNNDFLTEFKRNENSGISAPAL